MKKVFLFFLMSVCICETCVYAQNTTGFKPLRYDDDYTGLKKDSTPGWYTKTKYNPLSKNGAMYFSLGGETRYQYFYFKHEDWGEAPKDKDGYILTRYLAHVDFHAGKYVRSFIQLQSSLANGKLTRPSGVEENQLDLHQAFIDIVLPVFSKPQKLLFRFGRQELMFGSQRLVAVRDGPNNRQSFDGVKLMYSNDRFKADAFFSHYVLSRQNIFDDGFNKNTKFWGTYIVVNKIPFLQNADIYYLGLSKAAAVFDDGQGKELRHSIGARIWKKSGDWQYDFEGLYQFGKLASNRITAWTISSNTSYRFKSSRFSPQLGLKTELITGDKNYNDGKLNSFNPLFPRGAYFGLAALIGPSNLADIHPSVSFELSKTIDLNFDCDVFWRYSANDGIYAPNVSMIYSGKNSSSKFIGEQYAAELAYTPNAFLYFRAELTWFKTGAYLKAVSPGRDILFTGLTAQLKF